jgi:hypothetical protein
MKISFVTQQNQNKQYNYLGAALTVPIITVITIKSGYRCSFEDVDDII